MSEPAALPRLAITVGEPAGVGAELVLRLLERDWPLPLVLIGDPQHLASTAAAHGLRFVPTPFDPAAPRRPQRAGTALVQPVPLAVPVRPGQLDPRNADAVLRMLAAASDGALDGRWQGVVTAPVQKSLLAGAGHPFTGHTEFFAERAGRDVVMLLAAPGLRVALATTHLPLSAVPAAITRDGLARTVRVLAADLRGRFGLAAPRIAVLGLNPHAGEGGHLGREEIEVIAPTLDALRAEGLQIEGPLSADTAFLPARRARTDAYLAMYHDQGLPVLKALGFGEAVNVTLGLPYVRTSVDHGTALDLAGTGRADPASLVAAATLAIDLIRR